MFGAEIGQFPVLTDKIKAWRCNNLASRDGVFYSVFSSADFSGLTASKKPGSGLLAGEDAVSEHRQRLPTVVVEPLTDKSSLLLYVTGQSEN